VADIYINYGEDACQMTYDLMERAGVCGGLTPGMRVAIKPNLVVARPAEGGATTHPGIVEGIIRYLQNAGIRDIAITEGAWVGDSTVAGFRNCGYTALAERYGVELIDTKGDKTVRVKSQGIDLLICKSVYEADYLINVPVLKGHCQTDMTCCLKNLKGCIPDPEKRRFHSMGLHKPIAALAAALKPSLHIIDSICGDLSFEEGGNPVISTRVLLGFDGLLLDSYGAGLMGYQPDEIAYLTYAKQFGVGRYADAATEITEMNPERRPVSVPQPSRHARQLAAHIDEDSACSACYAALIFALHKKAYHGEKIKIGQGFKGKQLDGIGVGSCTKGCTRSLAGCPPRAVDIVEFLG
jgi:uncharacterized protein (DUF362 family)